MSPHLERAFVADERNTPSCHAATICELSDGDLLCAWFGGTHESHCDVAIFTARRTGSTWSEPRRVADGHEFGNPDFSCYNPVLHCGRELLLFYKVGTGPQTWRGAAMRSDDEGRTWHIPETLPDGILGPIKNAPLLLESGELLCPSSSEHDGWRVHFERLQDGGRTWDRTGPIRGDGIDAIQPSILRLTNGGLAAVGRTGQGRLFYTHGDGQGRNWSNLELLDVPNPNSGTDAITLHDGSHLLAYNHSSTSRYPLNLALSDDAVHWRSVMTLESEEGEFSYPSLIQARDGHVHVVYTWHRRRIAIVTLDPASLGA